MMFGPPTSHPKAETNISAARAARRQELAQIIAAKQQQLARVRTEQPTPGRIVGQAAAPVRGAPSVVVHDGERCTATPPVRLVRNKENQLPRQPAKSSSTPKPQVAGYPQSTPAKSQTIDGNDKPKSILKKDGKNSMPESEAQDTHEIEEMYNFDLQKVEEMVKTREHDSDTLDVAKVQSDHVAKPALAIPSLPEPAVTALDKVLAADNYTSPHFDDVPKRARRKSAPGPGEVMMPRADEYCHPPRASWQDAGLRQLAAENRELKQRTAQLESEYQRIAQLTMPAQEAPSEEASAFAEMD